ncbi:MAG: GH3 auxin-responsive promoter family protein [Candidatus Hodarchaeota archaeon]
MIGRIAHKIAKIRVPRLINVLESPEEQQKNILLKVIDRNADTFFGKKHQFSEIRSIESFQNKIPLQTHSDFIPYLNMIDKGQKGILTKENVIRWLQTSGTTGLPKYLPMTKTGLKAFVTSSRRLLGFAADSLEFARVLDGRILIYAASARTGMKGGKPVGFISGVSAAYFSNLITNRVLTLPSKRVLRCTNLNDRLWLFAKEIIPKDIRMIIGVTPLALSLVRAIYEDLPERLAIEFRNTKIGELIASIMNKNDQKLPVNEIWSNLKVFIHSGVHVEPYIKYIRESMGNIELREMYLGSEGAYAIQMKGDLPPILSSDVYFFEFIPESDINKNNPRRLLVNEVKKNQVYELVITNWDGLYAYRIGDLVKIYETNPVCIRVHGRTKTTVNLTGEKITEMHVSQGIQHAIEVAGIQVRNYSLIGFIENTVGKYILVIEFIEQNVEPVVLSKFIRAFDGKIRDTNPDWAVTRDSGVLMEPKIFQVKSGVMEEYINRRAAQIGNPGQLLTTQIKPPYLSGDPGLLSEFQSINNQI